MVNSETEIRTKREIIHTWRIDTNSIVLNRSDKIYFSILSKAIVNNTHFWTVYTSMNHPKDKFLRINIIFNKKWLQTEGVYISSFIVYSTASSLDDFQEVYETQTVTKDILLRKRIPSINVFDANNPLLQFVLKFKACFNDKLSLEDVKRASTEIEVTGVLEPVFNKKKFSDVKIVVDGEEFYVYKGILASQSPVFAAMFEHDMKENEENIVEITDIAREIIKEMLYFIYVGKVNNIDVVALDLLAAAEKYELKKLKTLCERTLIDSLKVENATGLLIQAEKYSAENLKETALAFFRTNAKKIIQSENYKSNVSNLLPVLTELIESLVL